MNETDKEIIKTSKEGFSLFDNAEIVSGIPSSIWFKNEDKQKEMFDFFDKLPEGNTYKIRFPDVKIWKVYGQRLRFFAGYYHKGQSLTIASRSNDLGYYIFIKKKSSEVKNEKNMEVKSV